MRRDLEKFISIEEIAKELGVTQRRTQQMAARRLLPASLIGRNYLILRSIWEAWIEEHAVAAMANAASASADMAHTGVPA